jgi:Zn finger protein HypA/HybF involved in hydrogenase expression
MPGVNPEFAMVSELYDVSTKLLGEVLQMDKKPTKVRATRIRKLLNAAAQNVKLAKKDFKEYTMEKFGVKEKAESVEAAHSTGKCIRCGAFLSNEAKESDVVVCDNCGSEPYESREGEDASGTSKS